MRSLTIENPRDLFTPVSLLNELRRDLYGKIKVEEYQGELPELPPAQKKSEPRKFVIKTDNLDYLQQLDLDNFAEIVYLLGAKDNIDNLRKLPKNKVRIALPAVCRAPQIYADNISRLLDGGYHKWEVANYWGLQMLPVEKLDISLDSSVYMLNSQAMAMAAEMGVNRVTLSLEDIKLNICNIIEKSPIKTTLIIYQDVPLFTSVGCIRDNDCRHCGREPQWFSLEQHGRQFKALSQNYQMMVFDE